VDFGSFGYLFVRCDVDDLPENIIKTVVTKVSYECTDCRARFHLGEYSEPGRAEIVLDEWISRHKPGHRVSY